MYGPSPYCKRKVKMAGGLRKCIRPFGEQMLWAHDGMRCALVLTSFTASMACSPLQVSRAPGSTVFAISSFASRPGRFVVPIVAIPSTGMLMVLHSDGHPGKRRRALVETNPPRNTRLRLIETVKNRGRSEVTLRLRAKQSPDERSPMPEKTHATSCGAAASKLLFSNAGRYVSPLANKAHAMRAILLARAMVATLGWHRETNSPSQALRPGVCFSRHCITDRAPPCTRSLRR